MSAQRFADDAPETGKWITPEEYKEMKNKQSQETPVETKDDYSDRLFSDYERFKADVNSDGKVSSDEYREFVLSKGDKTAETFQSTSFYELNINVVFITVALCVTLVIVSLIRKKRT